MEKGQESGGGGLRDAIVTLPIWAIALLAVLCIGSLALVLWVVGFSAKDELKASALQLLVVIIPLSSAIVAAIAMRRTSTRQIDRLVTAFLEKTLLERFQTWTSVSQSHPQSSFAYPFSSVKLCEPTRGRSYAYYSFSETAAGREVIVGAKSNVFNFEIFSKLPLHLPPDIDVGALGSIAICETKALAAIQDHPVLAKFFGLIQGSVNEGYELRFSFEPDQAGANAPGELKAFAMNISLRQKVRENFLASPFLKRYFAEDAAIAVGVLFTEWRTSGFMPCAIQEQSCED